MAGFVDVSFAVPDGALEYQMAAYIYLASSRSQEGQKSAVKIPGLDAPGHIKGCLGSNSLW
jgi:hypothetical protein